MKTHSRISRVAALSRLAALALSIGASVCAAADVVVQANSQYFNGWEFTSITNPPGTGMTIYMTAGQTGSGVLKGQPFSFSTAATPTPNSFGVFPNGWNTFGTNLPANINAPSPGPGQMFIAIGTMTISFTQPVPAGTGFFTQDFDNGEAADYYFLDCAGNPLDSSNFDFLQISTINTPTHAVVGSGTASHWHMAASVVNDPNTVNGLILNSGQVCSIRIEATRPVNGGSVNYFLGTPPTQSLVVTKTVTGAPQGYGDDFPITVACTLGGNDVSNQLMPSATQTVTAGTGTDGTATFTDVPQGATCAVSEGALPAAPANYAWRADTPTIDPSSVTIGTSAATATVTNALQRQSSTIDLTKTVAGGPSTGITATFDFTVDCGTDGTFAGTVDLANATSGIGSIADVPAGAVCTVSEAAIPAAPTNYQWGTTPAAVSVTTTAAGPNTAAFTNTLTRQTNAITLTKTVTGGPSTGVTATFGFTADCGTEGTFTGTVVLADATSGTGSIANVPAGATCAVGETTIPAPPAWYQWGTVPSVVSVTTTAAGPNTASFTNTLTAIDPPFTLTKTVSGGPAGGISGTFAFTIDCGAVGVFTQSVTLANATSGSVTISNIPGGTSCTFSESPSLPIAPSGFAWGALPPAQARTIDGTAVSFANSLTKAIPPEAAVSAPALGGWALMLLGWVTALAGAVGTRNRIAGKRSE